MLNTRGVDRIDRVDSKFMQAGETPVLLANRFALKAKILPSLGSGLEDFKKVR